MLRLLDRDHFLKAAVHAAALGTDTLEDFLSRVLRFADDPDSLVVIAPDQDPRHRFSFTFAWSIRDEENPGTYKLKFDGLILFSESNEMWSTHT